MITLALIAASIFVAALIGRSIYCDGGSPAYLRQLKKDRLRRSKRKTKSDVVWIQPGAK